MGSASRSLSENHAEKVVFNGSPSESSGPQSAKPGLFFAGEPASAFEGSTGVVAGTGDLIKRRWSGGGGGRQLGPGIVGSRSSPGAVFVEQVSAPVFLGENTPDNADFTGAGSENEFHDEQIVVPGSSGVATHWSADCGEVNFNDSQLLLVPGLLEKGTSRGQWEVADVATVWPSSSAVSSVAGRRRRQAPVACVPSPVAGGNRAERQCNEAGSLFVSQDVASIRVENPSSRVARVNTALHLNSYSAPTRSLHVVHNSHARMSHARCVVNSVGDTEDGRRLSCVYGGTKSLSTCTRTGVRRPAVEKLASPQQAFLKLHDEMWAGLPMNLGPRIFREVEIVSGCAVRVACPSCPDYYPEPSGPGTEIRNMLGWSQLEKTVRSGVWLFRGALQGENLFISLCAAGNCLKKGSYLTAWSVPWVPRVLVRTRTGGHSYRAAYWRAVLATACRFVEGHRAPDEAMEADRKVPAAANLTLYRGWNSRVGWHCDDAPLFGECGEAKLIVSVSFGTHALSRWKGKSCPDGEASSCCLDHGHILVMDGQCQDEFLHCTNPCRNRNGLTLRSVGSNNMHPLVHSSGQELHVVCQRVRRVHQFLLRGLW